jgi:hypothetical protein
LALDPGLALTDDSFSQQALGFTFVWYGVPYTDVYVGSNGFITFGSGSSTFSESASSMLANQPRIAGWWDDLNPSSGGTVSFATDNAGTAEICFSAVPEYYSTGSNDFMMTISSAGLVFLDY